MDSEFSMNELVDPVPSAPAPAALDEWAQIFNGLRQRYAGASDGVLFCILKLQQNPDIRLRDFKDEAALHRVPLSGRSHHSARVLLGLEKPSPPRARKGAPFESEASNGPLAKLTEALASTQAAGAESPLISALRRYQADHTVEMDRLRAGVRAAIDIIDAALDGD